MMIGAGCRVLLLSLTLGLSAIGAATAGLLPQGGEAQYELKFWESISNSTNEEDYKAYLKAYPNGRFAPLANARAARYAKSGSAAAAPPAPPVEEMDVQYDVVSTANVRKEPSSRADFIVDLAGGDRVHVTGRTQDKSWYRVELADGTTGFVYAQLLRKSVTVPVAKPEPPVFKPSPAPAPTPVVAQHTGSISDCDRCPEMVTLLPGSFVMGDDRDDRSEKPAHRVTIRKAFAIGKYQVTLAQWEACVQAGACKAIPDATGWSDQSPARNLSWTDAQQYVRWLSKRTGQNYRLPTEAEWEYAARAGTSTRYWWGEKMEPAKANCKGCGGDWNNDAPVNLDAFPPNPFGIYGMNGSVWEWVEDCWHKDYHGAPTDGSAWTSSDCRENVIRGGSWRNDSTYAYSASRLAYDTTVRYILQGFRVAKTLP